MKEQFHPPYDPRIGVSVLGPDISAGSRTLPVGDPDEGGEAPAWCPLDDPEAE